jgi:hypothetical protein
MRPTNLGMKGDYDTSKSMNSMESWRMALEAIKNQGYQMREDVYYEAYLMLHLL